MYMDSGFSFDFPTIMKCFKSMVTDYRNAFQDSWYISSAEAPEKFTEIDTKACNLSHSLQEYIMFRNFRNEIYFFGGKFLLSCFERNSFILANNILG